MKKLLFLNVSLLLLLVCSTGSADAQNNLFDEIRGQGTGARLREARSLATQLAPISNLLQSDPDLEPGFPVQAWHLPGSYTTFAGIYTRVGNIDADPQLEILVSGMIQGPLYAWKPDGSLVPGWPAYYYNRTFYPTLGHLSNETAGMEIFSGQYIAREPEMPPGPLLAYSGSGEILAGWPKESEYDVPAPGTLADLNGDGKDEIIVYEGQYLIHAYTADGFPLPGWPVAGESFTHAVADLDQDGDLEIITIINWSSEGANLVAYHHTGERVANFDLRFKTFKRPLPAIGDVDGDGSPEIVIVASGWYGYPDSECYYWVLIVSSSGQIERFLPATFTTTYRWVGISPAPALADLDNDQIPEIILAQGGALSVWKGDGTPFPGFPIVWEVSSDVDVGDTAPVVGDVDGDQQPDIVLTNITPTSSTYAAVYVFDKYGHLHPHFPKNLRIGDGGVPSIADIDLDGRNEIIITGFYWDGNPGNYDKVWVYDLGGGPHGKIEWGQSGGGPQNWGLYPPPPTFAGTDLYLSAPVLASALPGKAASLPLLMGNKGVTNASNLTMTATLADGLIYLSDTSGVTPAISGQTITWNLPSLGYLIKRYFVLAVQLPAGAVIGERFNVELVLSSAPPEAKPLDNTMTIQVQAAHQIYLPEVKK